MKKELKRTSIDGNYLKFFWISNINTKSSSSISVTVSKSCKNSLLQLWLDTIRHRNLTSYCQLYQSLIFSLRFIRLFLSLPFPFCDNSSSSFIKTFPRSRFFPRTLIFHLSRHQILISSRSNTRRDTRRYKLDDFRNSHAMEMIHLARNTESTW